MKPWYVSIWDEGQYVDLWSVNHTIAGLLTYIVSALLNLPFIAGLTIMVLLAAGWEIFEIIRQIQETFSNRVVDIFIAMAAFSLMHYLVNRFEEINLIQSGMILGCLAIILNVWGFWAMEIENNH